MYDHKTCHENYFATVSISCKVFWVPALVKIEKPFLQMLITAMKIILK